MSMWATVRRLTVLAAVLWASMTAEAARDMAPLKRIVPDYMDGKLEIAITPTPQFSDLKDVAFGIGRALLLMPAKYDAPESLVRELTALLGADNLTVGDSSKEAWQAAQTIIFVGRQPEHADWAQLAGRRDLAKLLADIPGKGDDAYVLYSKERRLKGKNVVMLVGNSPAADFWAFATLRQLIFRYEDGQYLRIATIFDYPAFKFRGNKRPRQWEWRYKANYAWSFAAPVANSERRPYANFRWDYFRQHGSWRHYGNRMEATDAEMDQLIEGYETKDKNGRVKKVAGAKEYYAQGCREFVLKFDDSGWKLSKAAAKKFDTGNPYYDYFKALNYFVNGMHRRIKAIDPENRVLFMPRAYWYNCFEQPEFTANLLKHGPLPKDMGLSVCGPEVISWSIPTACMSDFRQLYGFERKAQIYDNFGRGGEFFAFRERDPDLWTEVECLFPERGTPVTRITVYDYLWNPQAYDPERSLKLALRELSNRDPALYKAMLDFVLYYNANRNFPPYVDSAHVKERLPRINRTMKQKFDALVPLLERSPLGVELDLKREFWGNEKGPSYVWGEYASLRRRIEFEPFVLAYAHREGRIFPTADAIAVDGALDEAAWAKAKPFPEFVRPAWGRKELPESWDELIIPPEESTRMKMLYSKTHLYVAAEFNYKKKPTLPGWAEGVWRDKKPGDQANLAWRVPCFELFFDPGGKRQEYRQIVSNIAGLWMAQHCRTVVRRKSGGWWQPQWRFQYKLGETSGSFEASVPLADLAAEMPTKGTVWGGQAYRSKMGAFGLFSGVYDLVGGEHATREFGRFVFE